MASDRWKQVDSLLQLALERPLGERDAFLRHACAGDEALEREVRSLLASQQQAGSFLESPAIEVAARALGGQRSQDAHERADFRIGEGVSRLGPYEILARIGAGGMGEVYKARDTRLQRIVAIKILPEHLSSMPQLRERFEREARAISSLSHPHICLLYDVGDQDGIHYLVMEYLEGETLAERLKKGPLPLEHALRYAIEIAGALDHAHRHGVIHRDLKPGNIILTKLAAKVLDFGLAKVRTAEAEPGLTQPTSMLTEHGAIIGTLQYMAPEQLEAKEADARTDIFALGALLYEMATGKKAFEGKSRASLIAAILEHEPAQISSLKAMIPPALDWLVKRCLAKDPEDRVQTASDLKSELQWVAEQEPGSTSRGLAPTAQNRRWRIWAGLAVAVVVAVGVTGYRLRDSDALLLPRKLTRLTNDTGLSDFAALSPDGKLVAYASDRSLDGEPDLYIKQITGGQPIRLTSDGEGNTTPDFSPDGSKIVFRSNRDGGGVYEIPAFGGEVRLVARDGVNPKFSPDGSQVAYWIGNEEVDAAIPGSGAVWVVPTAGGPSQRVGPNFTAARHPIWSPDGKHLLLIGYTSTTAFQASSIDWWVVATNGSDAVKTGAYEALVHAGLRAIHVGSDVPQPACWSPTANTVMFSRATGDTDNLWEIGISARTGRVSGVKRLTTGAGHEMHPSCAPGGALTFTNEEVRSDVWSLSFDLDSGTPDRALERITQGPASRGYASLASNGRYVAFSSDQSGQENIWIRDLATGKESSVSASPFVEGYPAINASGARIAFSVYEKDKRVVYVSTPGGAPEKLCEGCLRATDWSRDDKAVLVFGGNPYQINILDLATHQQMPLLKHPNHNLLYGRFSPDNRWASFTVRTEPNRGYIAIAPLDGPKPVPESAWITIAQSEAQDWANWSPDGKTLYFTSHRDGHICLWGQRLEAGSHRPAGEAFAVQHFHGRVSYRQGGWSAAGGRIGLVLEEDIGNIWVMSR